MAHSPPDDSRLSARERHDAQTLAEHLPPGYTAEFVQGETEIGADISGERTRDGEPSNREVRQQLSSPPMRPSSTTSNVSAGSRREEVSSLTLQGGDLHRSLFRMAEAPARTHVMHQPQPQGETSSSASSIHHRRAATVHEPLVGDGSRKYGSTADRWDPKPMPVRDMMAPQGFRRAFLQQRRQRGAMQRRRELRHERRRSSFGAARIPITRNFVEFLELYGHFADEDLETSDEEDGGPEEEEEEDEDDMDLERGAGSGDEDRRHEREALLPRRTASGAGGESGKAKAGTAQAFFTLLKAFVGTGIMFLPKAYNNGGMAFSTATLLVVAVLSMAGFQLLLRCRQQYGGGYGDIGEAIAGKRMRGLILGSITLSQLGFVCAGMVFVAENMASFAAAVRASHGGDDSDEGVPSAAVLIGLEAAVLVPLALVRDIARLGPVALVGDVFIAVGLAYMYSFDISTISSRNWRPHETVEPWFNPSGYTLTIGAAIFTFEGIGLILPIQSSMAQPEHFGRLLGLVMAIITVAYVSVGALGYAAFGVDTRTEVIDNYPRDSALVQAVQCLYALAVLAGLPVQLFPAVRILEGQLFGWLGGRLESSRASGHRLSGKRDPRVKWVKNALRAAMVVLCAAVAVAGAGHLDRFVALIGSLACVPLLFIYPPYLHCRGVAVGTDRWRARAVDVVLMAIGTVAMVYTTAVTVAEGL
ncbi:amino acid transporter [Grosmannia clavigera kw1407]|uniref:Amino acid transporter n=1 Tax=Grosmannia clavigera (strain kw1407 / UAMH 11150) TaxID=655863 RepID=F0XHU5_GROCL|nr:amino acid transporter [Grosmannia clavigera kw1407]EFX02724.1 amino acid transporter [Grosmannia clavigera kw1407]